MNSNSSKGLNGLNPETLVPVLAVRDVDQNDIRPGVYRSPDGDYWRATFDNVTRIAGPASRLTFHEAFKLVIQLRAVIRPGMNVWDEGMPAFESDLEVMASPVFAAAAANHSTGQPLQSSPAGKEIGIERGLPVRKPKLKRAICSFEAEPEVAALLDKAAKLGLGKGRGINRALRKYLPKRMDPEIGFSEGTPEWYRIAMTLSKRDRLQAAREMERRARVIRGTVFSNLEGGQ